VAEEEAKSAEVGLRKENPQKRGKRDSCTKNDELSKGVIVGKAMICGNNIIEWLQPWFISKFDDWLFGIILDQ
jgi:hypothetical protein